MKFEVVLRIAGSFLGGVLISHIVGCSVTTSPVSEKLPVAPGSPCIINLLDDGGLVEPQITLANEELLNQLKKRNLEKRVNIIRIGNTFSLSASGSDDIQTTNKLNEIQQTMLSNAITQIEDNSISTGAGFVLGFRNDTLVVCPKISKKAK